MATATHLSHLLANFALIRAEAEGMLVGVLPLLIFLLSLVD